MAIPMPSVTPSVVPATATTTSSLRAPQACPIRMLAPAVIPIRNEMKKNASGMNVARDASACVPRICPTAMLLIVMVSDCRMFCAISGSTKARKLRQSGPGCGCEAGGMAYPSGLSCWVGGRTRGFGGASRRGTLGPGAAGFNACRGARVPP